MGLLVNLVVQTVVWFALMGAIIFGAAGTTDYVGGWLFLGEMLAVSGVFGVYTARIDSGLLRERLKPDDVLIGEGEFQDYQALLSRFELRVVGLFAPLDVLEERERARNDREIGLAH